jgi:hypothetical protein
MVSSLAGRPITQLTYDELQDLLPEKRGWIIPTRSISALLPYFPYMQQLTVNLYAWAAAAAVLVSIILSIIRSWHWLGLLLLAVFLWRAMREGMERFYTANLEQDRQFYDTMRQLPIGEDTKFVSKDAYHQ